MPSMGPALIQPQPRRPHKANNPPTLSRASANPAELMEIARQIVSAGRNRSAGPLYCDIVTAAWLFVHHALVLARDSLLVIAACNLGNLSRRTFAVVRVNYLTGHQMAFCYQVVRATLGTARNYQRNQKRKTKWHNRPPGFQRWGLIASLKQ